MKHTTNILEELLESEYKGLIYIDEQNRIGSYSKRAKEITGIISENERCHAAGSIKEGDIVIICDNEIGNDDALLPADLLHININEKNIAKGDAIVAVGVYHNKKIKPQYKYIKSYSPNGKFELKTNYLGFEEELRHLGKGLRYNKKFPKGANVNFYEITGRDTLTELTYERGVEDFTMACGTGTGSVAAVLTEKNLVSGNDVRVSVPGGELFITIKKDPESGSVKDLFLTGPTNIVAEGVVTDEELLL